MPWTLRMTLYACAVGILPYLFVGWRLNSALHLIFPDHKKLIKRMILVLFIFLNLLPFIVLILYFTGNAGIYTSHHEITWFDIFIIFPFWIGFITIFELFFYFVGIEIIQFFSGKIKSRISERILKPAAYLRVILFISFLLYVSVKSYSDTYNVQIASYTANLKNLPAELHDLKLALVGDVQIDRYTQDKKIQAFHSQLTTVNPELLFFAGDLVTRGTHFIPQGLEVLCNTDPRMKRIACVGDHDIWSDARQIARGLVDCNWTFLDNQHHIVDLKGHKILVTGITYVYSRRSNPGQLKQLLGNAPEAVLKILLVHQPSQLVIQTAKEYGYHIMLAGHTHGGQIVFKPFGITLTPTMFENSFYSGQYDLGSLNLFITNGIGLTMMPLRFRAPAEIQEIILKAGK